MIDIIEKGNQFLDKFEEDKKTGKERLNDIKSAVEQYTKAIALDCDQSLAYGNRAAAYNWLNEYDKAFADICRAIELDPSNGVYLFNRGVAYAEKENWSLAFNDFFDAVKADSSLKSILKKIYRHRYKNILADEFYILLQKFTAEYGKDVFNEENFRPLLLDFSNGEYKNDIKTLLGIIKQNIIKEFKKSKNPEAVRKRVLQIAINESGRIMDILCCLLLYDEYFGE